MCVYASVARVTVMASSKFETHITFRALHGLETYMSSILCTYEEMEQCVNGNDMSFFLNRAQQALP